MGITRRGFLKGAATGALFLATRHPLFPLPGGQAKTVSSNPEVLTGKRWAMVVDLKKCKSDEGCRGCIEACHETHNVPDFRNDKDEIKWIWKAPPKKVFPEYEYLFSEEDWGEKPVLALCNHCDDPPCVKVCPTGSTWKRDDGIVMIDYHRCIGCRYCMAGCPYGSRSFNWKDPRPSIQSLKENFPTRTKGVVEKCNFCVERLTQGIQPACVEACPENALIFGNLNDKDSEVRKILKSNQVIQRQPELGTKPNVYYIV